MPLTVFMRALCGAFILHCAHAHSAHAAPLAFDWQAALLGNSERLKLYSLVLGHPEGSARLVGGLRRNLGLDQKVGAPPKLVEHGAFVLPVLYWDGNINGGYPGTTVIIAGLPFKIDEPYRARGGILAGLKGGGYYRWAVGPGLTLSAFAFGSAARAPLLGLNVYSAQMSGCASQTFGYLNWVDLCAGNISQVRKLSTTHERFLSFGLGRLAQSFGSPAQIEVTFRRGIDPGWTRNSLIFGAELARRRIGDVRASFRVGEKVPGQMTELYGGSLSLARPIYSHDATFSVRYGYSSGASLFGTDRRDRAFGGAVSMTWRGLRGTLSVSRTLSTIPACSGTVATFSVDLRNFLDRKRR